MQLSLRLQTEEFRLEISAWMLEQMPRRLRALTKPTEGDERQINYTNLQDEICDGAVIALAHSLPMVLHDA